MPKKIEPEEEEFEEEEEEEEEIEEPVQQKGRGRPVKKYPPLPKRPAAHPQQPQAPQVRYTAFAQQAAEGIMDSETQEVIATDMWTALANIIERLERMENAIGVMQEG